MTVSSSGKTMIKGFEGLRLTVYDDGAGNLTVGYGHKVVSGDNLKSGDTISQQKADAFFSSDIQVAENAINKLPKISKITQDQFDAIASLVFNVGTKPVTDTNNDLYKALNKDTFVQSEVVTGFTYTKVNGVRNKGLVDRRNKELNLFFGTSNVEYITMT